MNKNQTINYLHQLKAYGQDYHDDIVPPCTTKAPTIPTDMSNIEELNDTISHCYMCELHKQSKHSYIPPRNTDAKIMFIDDFAANHSDPYIGQSGKMLENICKNVLKLDKTQVYITYIIRCPIVDGSAITTAQIDMCSHYLQREIDMIGPAVVVCFENKISSRLNLKLDNTKLITTHSPSYLLRNPSQKSKTMEDMKKIYAILTES